MARESAQPVGPRTTGSVWQVGLLGEFGASLEGAPTDLPMCSQRLIAFLALNRGPPTARGHVAATLWPDLVEDRGTANLRSTIWRLRRQAPGLLEADESHVALCGGVEVDEHALTRLADACATLQPEDLDRLRDLCLRGELLPSWLDEWVLPHQDRVRQVRLQALEQMTTLLTEAGDLSKAVRAGLAAIASDPLRESAYRALIGAHLADGNKAEALRLYGTFRTLLLDHAGCEPSPLIDRLVGTILVDPRSD